MLSLNRRTLLGPSRATCRHGPWRFPVRGVSRSVAFPGPWQELSKLRNEGACFTGRRFIGHRLPIADCPAVCAAALARLGTSGTRTVPSNSTKPQFQASWRGLCLMPAGWPTSASPHRPDPLSDRGVPGRQWGHLSPPRRQGWRLSSCPTAWIGSLGCCFRRKYYPPGAESSRNAFSHCPGARRLKVVAPG